MANNNKQQSLRELFLKLPEKIRDWITSDRVTYSLIEINKRLGLVGAEIEVVPDLISRLLVKELDPRDFVGTLSRELGIDLPSAKNISQEVQEKILRPIAADLRKEINLDITEITFGETPAAFVPQKPESEEKPTEEKPLPVVEIPIEAEKPAPPKPPTPPQPPVEAEAKGEPEPFVIHKEAKTFEVPVQIRKPTPPQPSKAQQTKVAIKPEPTSAKLLPKTQHANVHRVVHYSNFRTPIE